MSDSAGLTRLAAFVLFVAAALEIARAATAPAFPGLGIPLALALRAVIAAIWIGCSAAITAAIVRRRRRPVLATRIGWIALSGYGLAETLVGIEDGGAHLVAAMLVALAAEWTPGGTDDRERDPRALVRGA